MKLKTSCGNNCHPKSFWRADANLRSPMKPTSRPGFKVICRTFLECQQDPKSPEGDCSSLCTFWPPIAERFRSLAIYRVFGTITIRACGSP